MDPADAGWRGSILALLARIILGGSVPILTFGWIVDPSRISLWVTAFALLPPLVPAAIQRLPLPLRGAGVLATLVGIGCVATHYYGPVPGSPSSASTRAVPTSPSSDCPPTPSRRSGPAASPPA